MIRRAKGLARGFACLRRRAAVAGGRDLKFSKKKARRRYIRALRAFRPALAGSVLRMHSTTVGSADGLHRVGGPRAWSYDPKLISCVDQPLTLDNAHDTAPATRDARER
jgi:hypothetical protein